MFKTVAYFIDFFRSSNAEEVNSNQFTFRLNHARQLINGSISILNKPYGETSYEDILSIELAQEFDRYLDHHIAMEQIDELLYGFLTDDQISTPRSTPQSD